MTTQLFVSIIGGRFDKIWQKMTVVAALAMTSWSEASGDRERQR